MEDKITNDIRYWHVEHGVTREIYVDGTILKVKKQTEKDPIRLVKEFLDIFEIKYVTDFKKEEYEGNIPEITLTDYGSSNSGEIYSKNYYSTKHNKYKNYFINRSELFGTKLDSINSVPIYKKILKRLGRELKSNIFTAKEVGKVIEKCYKEMGIDNINFSYDTNRKRGSCYIRYLLNNNYVDKEDDDFMTRIKVKFNNKYFNDFDITQ